MQEEVLTGNVRLIKFMLNVMTLVFYLKLVLRK